jgi:hypothetical protein
VPPADVEPPAPTVGDDGRQADENGGREVVPLAPLDVRMRQGLERLLKLVPRWSERAPSPAEELAYSKRGDWRPDGPSAVRVWRNLTVCLAFALTVPVDTLSRAVKRSPGLFWLLVILALIVF